MTTKISVSLPDADVAFLDALAGTRSAAVAAGVRLLRERELEAQYADAYREWEESGEAAAWDVTAGDGLDQPGSEWEPRP